MVRVTIVDDHVQFEVEGWDKVWALKSHLEIPLRHITGARIDPDAAAGWWHGIKMPGTNVPGVITAGTFVQHDGRVFFDVHDPRRTIVVDLDHESYRHLVIEVDDPAAVVAQLSAAISDRK